MLVDILVKLGASKANAEKYATPIQQTMDRYGINTPLRKAHFLAQIFHESGSLVYNKEIASGQAYEGRKDLGNTSPGDGPKFCGRGFLQVTGKSNYQKASDYFKEDFISHPEMLETPTYAALTAGWFWDTHKLNNLADKDDGKGVTKIINGGYNGLQSRMELLARAKKLLNE